MNNGNMGIFKKREIVENDTVLSEPVWKNLHQLFLCPICLDILRDAVATKGCSHRFCKECIEKTIRLNKKKVCPVCRRILGTKRELIQDNSLTEMITQVLGDVDAYIKEQNLKEQQQLNQKYQGIFSDEQKKRSYRKAIGKNPDQDDDDDLQQERLSQ